MGSRCPSCFAICFAWPPLRSKDKTKNVGGSVAPLDITEPGFHSNACVTKKVDNSRVAQSGCTGDDGRSRRPPRPTCCGQLLLGIKLMLHADIFPVHGRS